MIKSRLSRPRSLKPGDVERQPQITSAKHWRRRPRCKGRRLLSHGRSCSTPLGTVAGFLDQRWWHPPDHSIR